MGLNSPQEHKTFSLFIMRFGHTTCQEMLFFFVKRATIFIVYMDNIVVTCNNEVEIAWLNAHLRKEFEIKDVDILK